MTSSNSSEFRAGRLATNLARSGAGPAVQARRYKSPGVSRRRLLSPMSGLQPKGLGDAGLSPAELHPQAVRASSEGFRNLLPCPPGRPRLCQLALVRREHLPTAHEQLLPLNLADRVV